MTRGEIWWADFGIPFGSEPGFRRPVLIMQSDLYNKSSIQTIVIIPLTTNLALGEAPGNVFVNKQSSGLPKDSIAVVSQLYAIDKARMISKIKKLDKPGIDEVEQGILLVLGIRK